MKHLFVLLFLFSSTIAQAVHQYERYPRYLTSPIDQGGLPFQDAGNNTVTLVAPATVTGTYTLTLPPSICQNGQFLESNALGQLSCGDGGISSSSFYSYVANQIPAKNPAESITFSNIALTGNPGTVNGYDYTFGGTLIVAGNTDDTENGLWTVNTGGAWVRDLSMPDNSLSCYGAIVPVENAGSTFGGTFWASTCDGSGSVHFTQMPTAGSTTGKAVSKMGSCTTGSSTPTTTVANLTCAGVPASTSVAVSCSTSAALSTATGNGVSCRASGSANTITCNTTLANVTAVTLTCQWMQP